MTSPEGHFITSSELTSSAIELRVVFVFFIICEMCAPLDMGRLGTQPFKVSETFSAPQCFKLLLAQGTILLNSRGIQLEPVDFCMDFLIFFIVLLVVEEVSCDTPVIHPAHTFKHVEELACGLVRTP
jgi:hypothetical protein